MKIQNFYIEDMIEAIELIQEYLRSATEIDFSRNKELQDAVIRRLMIVGEAATKINDYCVSKCRNPRICKCVHGKSMGNLLSGSSIALYKIESDSSKVTTTTKSGSIE